MCRCEGEAGRQWQAGGNEEGAKASGPDGGGIHEQLNCWRMSSCPSSANPVPPHPLLPSRSTASARQPPCLPLPPRRPSLPKRAQRRRRREPSPPKRGPRQRGRRMRRQAATRLCCPPSCELGRVLGGQRWQGMPLSQGATVLQPGVWLPNPPVAHMQHALPRVHQILTAALLPTSVHMGWTRSWQAAQGEAGQLAGGLPAPRLRLCCTITNCPRNARV